MDGGAFAFAFSSKREWDANLPSFDQAAASGVKRAKRPRESVEIFIIALYQAYRTEKPSCCWQGAMGGREELRDLFLSFFFSLRRELVGAGERSE